MQYTMWCFPSLCQIAELFCVTVIAGLCQTLGPFILKLSQHKPSMMAQQMLDVLRRYKKDHLILSPFLPTHISSISYVKLEVVLKNWTCITPSVELY